MLVDILLLVVGLVILTYGADKFVEGASSLAKKFNVSDLAIGLTVVAFGTSAPELIVNVFAAVGGNNGIAYGNIIGSNSFNLMLILGIAALIYPLTAHPNIVRKDTGYSLLAALLVFILVNDQLLWGVAPATEGFNNYPASAPVLDKTGATIGTTFFGGIMSRLDAGILLIFFGYFLYYVFKNTSADQGGEEEEGVKELNPTMTAIFTIGGLAGLVVGGKLIVDSAVSMATAWGMSEKMIGLTIVSAGTSLPELATSCIAAYKKKSDIAIANVIGSNIFNIFFILAASAMIAPIPFEASALNIDIYVLIAATVVFFVFLFMSKPVEMGEKDAAGKPLMGRVFQRWQGLVFLIAYIGYTIYLIKRG